MNDVKVYTKNDKKALADGNSNRAVFVSDEAILAMIQGRCFGGRGCIFEYNQSMLWDVLIMLFLMAAYGGVHSLLAARRSKAWAARRLGVAGQRFYRLFFVLFAALSFLPIGLWLLLHPGTVLYRVPAPFSWGLLALQGACAAGLLITFLQTGVLAFLGLDAFLPNRDRPGRPALVQTGLYRWVRHPVYTLSLIMLFAMPIMTTTWLGLSLGALFYILVALPWEESKLLDEFGDAYRDYRQRTPALIPGVKMRS